MNKHLITDLTDIVGDYTDEKTYDNLTIIDSNNFTKKKLIKNMLNEVPINDISIFLKAHRLMEEWKIAKKDIDLKNENTPGIITIFIKIILLYGDVKFDELEKLRYDSFSKGIYSNCNLIERINLAALDVDHDLDRNIYCQDIYKNLSDSYKENFINLLDGRYKNKQDIITLLKFYLVEQIKILMNKDLKFHPLLNFKEYESKLLEMVLDHLKKKKEDKQ